MKLGMASELLKQYDIDFIIFAFGLVLFCDTVIAVFSIMNNGTSKLRLNWHDEGLVSAATFILDRSLRELHQCCHLLV